MELLHSLAEGLSSQDAITLVLLALIDSTSMGTLVLPLVLLLFTSSGGRAGARSVAVRVAGYLVAIGFFYWLLGLVLLSGVDLALQPLGAFFGSRPGAVLLLAAGIGLTVLSWWMDPKEVRKRGGDPDAATERWITRAERAVRSWRGLVALAVAAGVAEVATMLPYLAAIGGLAQSGLPYRASGLALAVYCVVMILPALLLAVARFALGGGIDRPVARIRDWAVCTTPTTLAWVIGIVGVVIIVRVAPTVLGG
ncbi:hypothetical protein FCK90_10100 [Kocuria coralli]|uniref:GAP family protein n=1 Tax=Kocuria coralli TaxID=1461025 RepID=A0A5J5KVQ8_9MICC|nr:GAP family protein [Kocuria coralli]KAA9393769.1 hypothetical protein FCK90_10100 [Kocuria coralli]